VITAGVLWNVITRGVLDFVVVHSLLDRNKVEVNTRAINFEMELLQENLK